MINPNELLYVVDTNNNPIEPLPRNIAHKNNVWHRTTGIWALNSNKHILCQKRSMQKDQNPGKWEAYFGGHLGPNEDHTESAVREVSEELGQSVTADQLIPYPYIVKSDKPTHREFQYIFTVFLNNDSSKFKFEQEEIDELTWVDFETVKKILLETKEENWVQKPWDQEILNWIATLRLPE